MEKKILYGTIPLVEGGIPKKNVSRLLILITLAFANFCAGACVSLQAPFFPAEAEKKGATATAYGLIFGIFQLTIFICAPIMGKFVSVFRPKYLLNAGIFLLGVTCILFGTLDLVENKSSFVALAFVIRSIEGIGAAALRTSCYTIIASQVTEGLATTFAIMETFLGIGLITGPTLGGLLYDLGGYGLPFYTIGTIVVIDAVVVFLVFPNIGSRKVIKNNNFLKFWLCPTTLTYSLAVFTSFNVIGFIQATLEPHLREFQFSGVFLGMMFALTGTVYAICAPAWGWLCDKKCKSPVLCLVGCLVMVAALLFIGPAPFFQMEPYVPVIIVSLILIGVALGGKLVSSFTGTLKNTVEKGFPSDLSTYGLVSSMIASSQSLGAFVGPSIGGYLLDRYGFRMASMALLVFETFLIIIIVFSTFFKKKSSEKESLISFSLKNTEIHKSISENGTAHE